MPTTRYLLPRTGNGQRSTDVAERRREHARSIPEGDIRMSILWRYPMQSHKLRYPFFHKWQTHHGITRRNKHFRSHRTIATSHTWNGDFGNPSLARRARSLHSPIAVAASKTCKKKRQRLLVFLRGIRHVSLDVLS